MHSGLELISLRDTQSNEVVFETFEASPSSEAVLAAPYRLQWEFPTQSAKISAADFDDPAFQQSLANLLQDDASSEALDFLRATVVKADSSIAEIRDTADSSLIFNMRMPVLEAIGSAVAVPLLNKRVCDDVNLGTGMRPWRRLPIWVVLRVSAQGHLCKALGDSKKGNRTQGRACYNFLISLLLVGFLEDCCSGGFRRIQSVQHPTAHCQDLPTDGQTGERQSQH